MSDDCLELKMKVSAMNVVELAYAPALATGEHARIGGSFCFREIFGPT
jgi:hypothetical protein